jgi:signal transduction histidine kinase
MLRQWWCALVLLVWFGHAHATTPAIRADEIAASGSILIGRHLADLRDPSGALTLAQVMDPTRAGDFVPLEADRLKFGYDRAHHWLRFTIDPGPTGAHLVLEAALASLDLVELHSSEAGGGYKAKRSGDRIPWSERPLAHRNHAFRIDLDAGPPAVFYLHLASANTMTTSLALWTETAFARNERDAQLMFGMFYGLVLALFLYNLALYLSLGDRTYLWYVAYVGSFGMGLFVSDGFAFEYLWPDNVRWGNQALGTFLCLALMFGGLFARAFLGIRDRHAGLDRVMLALAIVAGVLAFLSATGWLLEYWAIMRALSLLGPLTAALTLWISVKAALNDYAPAKYFLLAWSTLLAFVMIGALRNFGLVPAIPVATYGLHVGLALDVVLLSVALASRIRITESRVIAAQGRLIEISHEHRTALERRAAELAESNRELESFSHTVAHDLRAPLRAIDGYAGFLALEHGDKLPEAGRRDLAAISNNARRMAQLIDRLLDFSRLGRLASHEGVVAMRPLVDAVLQEALAGHPVDVRIGDLGEVRGDPVLLRQVWANLIENAVKFSAGRGDAAIAVDGALDAHGVEYSVTDNGVGFEPAYADKLFGMFQRLHPAEAFAGTGAGLATVKRIVERHGGGVSAQSTPGRGARFAFHLPVGRVVKAPSIAA